MEVVAPGGHVDACMNENINTLVRFDIAEKEDLAPFPGTADDGRRGSGRRITGELGHARIVDAAFGQMPADGFGVRTV
ncbi:MAG: hypothetical protein R3D03_04545 [Geminicoccaceae bacterium]